MKTGLLLFAVIAFAISLETAISSAQRKPDTDPPIRGDFKITIKATASGQSTETTTMIKGVRARNESNMAVAGMTIKSVDITQCDISKALEGEARAVAAAVTKP